MTTLAIYDSLTEKDLSHGLKIAGTGTIDADGYVGDIDGVKHKINGAAKDEADIFFVPAGRNYEEATKTKKENNLKIEIVPVETLDDAIKYLENLKK
jgi:PDZ domain-containing protein